MSDQKRARTWGPGSTHDGASVIEFLDDGGAYAGVGRRGRAWRISRTFTGWRLEFKDPGDQVATYAGTHPTVAAAQSEAER